MKSIRLAIFASGNGTTAELLLKHFDKNKSISIAALMTNNPNAKVIQIAKEYDVDVEVSDNEEVNNANYLIDFCKKNKIHFVVLAGYLRKIPSEFIAHFPRRIINIHPSLLPKYGGHGMYGMHVHEAVWQQRETKTGISIHFVDEEFDHGEIIAQHGCDIDSEDSVQSIRQKVQDLEQRYFAIEVEKTIKR